MMRDPDRPLRADAQRNRDKILSTAVRVFADRGLDANLDTIAKEAGVGSGTLYRNFPTREILVEAAYQNELARLSELAPELLERLPAKDALRAWMGGFIDYATAKHGMADVLRAVIDAGRNPYARTHESLIESITLLLEAGVTAATIRADISAEDLLAAVSGIALSSAKPGHRDQAERLLDLTMDGLCVGVSADR